MVEFKLRSAQEMWDQAEKAAAAKRRNEITVIMARKTKKKVPRGGLEEAKKSVRFCKATRLGRRIRFRVSSPPVDSLCLRYVVSIRGVEQNQRIKKGVYS